MDEVNFYLNHFHLVNHVLNKDILVYFTICKMESFSGERPWKRVTRKWELWEWVVMCKADMSARSGDGQPWRLLLAVRLTKESVFIPIFVRKKIPTLYHNTLYLPIYCIIYYYLLWHHLLIKDVLIFASLFFIFFRKWLVHLYATKKLSYLADR